MRTIIKIAAAVFVAAITSGATYGQYYYGDNQQSSMQDWPDNDFTNKIVVPTVECYTNNQAAVSADQQSRVQQEGVVKGAAALQRGSRIETRPPTAYVTTDPWIQPDHPWDLYPNSPAITPIPASAPMTPAQPPVMYLPPPNINGR